jgi:hypothetical protein
LSNSDTTSWWRRKFGAAGLFVAVVLAIHFLLGLDAARRLTVTHDEYWHLPAGLSVWQTGRFDADNLNPPLCRIWSAWPLLLTSAKVDATVPPGDAFLLGDSFLSDNRPGYENFVTLARGMNLLFSVGTGLMLAVWAKQLFGRGAACLAASLWAFCPNALAHGALVTPDAGTACLFTATLFSAWQFSKRPGWSRAVCLGILLGAAQLTKFTCLILYPLCCLAWFVVRFRNWDLPEEHIGKTLAKWMTVGLMSLVVLNSGCLFRGSFRQLRDFRFQSRTLGDLASVLRPLGAVPVPLPRDYLEGLDHQRLMMEGQHPVYLDGKWSLNGFGDYYLRALAYKIPHATQGLCILSFLFAVISVCRSRANRGVVFLWLSAIAILGLASSIGMQLGIRYVLPAFPLLYLAASDAARLLTWSRYRLRTVLLLIPIAAVPLSLRLHPQHLAYFNELSGGAVGGREHLLDSNLDWGQDLRGLADYLQEHPVDDLGLAYFGMFPPSEMGIRYRLPPARRPEPGWYAVSVNFAYGRPHLIQNPDGVRRPADFEEFGYFRRLTPAARIGSSIDLYHIPPVKTARP